VTIRLGARGVRVVLLDVEGTTTPISFVTTVLFPYARSQLRAFLHAHASDVAVREAMDALRDERRRDDAGSSVTGEVDDETIAMYAESLMDRDSKSPGLKSLQGLIWKVGYESRALRGEVFEDVPPSLRRWRNAGLRTAIYSSGSVLAQKLLFASTPYGDLTEELDANFDTAVGAKREPASYRTIAQALAVDPDRIFFLSDVGAELEAARAAGCQAVLVARPGNPPQTEAVACEAVRTFLEIDV
jgi:enolase-phosphatase E1